LLHEAATGHTTHHYATALADLRYVPEPEAKGSTPDREAETVARPLRRALEDLRYVVEDRRSLLVDERGTGSTRRFDAYATATRGDDVLASGFDHQRGVIRTISLSSLPTPPGTPPSPDAHFDPPTRALVAEARGSLESLEPDAGSIRVVASTAADEAVPRPGGDAGQEATEVLGAAEQPVTRPPLPATIALTVGAHHLFLDREIRTAGAVGFVLTDPDTGQPARAGVRLSEDDGLPDAVLLDDDEVPLGPAHRWLLQERRFSDEAEPRDRARASHTRVSVGGNPYDLDLRVTRRSADQWTVRAKLTPSEAVTDAGEEGEMRPKPSIKGAPVLPTPLFKIDGRWNWRWSVRSGDTQVMLPRELFEMNEVDPESLTSATLPDGTEIELSPTKYGTGFSVQRIGALRKVSGGKPGDYVFIGVDLDARLSFHRVTKQLMGRVQSHMKMASLLCGLTDEHPTMPAVLWALGVADESGTIDDAIAICEQRSDGPLARELRSHANEAGPPPDLDEIFKSL
jgi:hypothetical protein